MTVKRVTHFLVAYFKSRQLSLFEKVILINSIMLIAEALIGLWVTSHNLETHHYLIDTSFLVVATLVTLLTNILFLRASFRPLFHLLATIRAVSAGKTQARASIASSTSEVGELGLAFNSMLDRLETVRREQTRLIFQAQEDERRRIALELHDEAGQNLTALLIHAELINQSFQQLPAAALTETAHIQLADELQQLIRLTQLTLENIRVLAQQLRPSVLDDLGLIPAFRWLVEDCTQRLHLHVRFVTNGFDLYTRLLPSTYETALFRIAQEGLTNIARHAHAQEATISLRHEQNSIYLEVQDNGCGYNLQRQHTGTGTLGMRERATLLGGTLTIRSQPAHGTTVQAILPFPRIIEEETSENRDQQGS